MTGQKGDKGDRGHLGLPVSSQVLALPFFGVALYSVLLFSFLIQPFDCFRNYITGSVQKRLH